MSQRRIAFFEKYLTLWVGLCMAAGILLGTNFPAVPQFLATLEFAHVSIPVAILIFIMIYPMMLKVDFTSVRLAFSKPKGLTVTCVVNWLIKPFTMYAIAAFFFFLVFRNFIPETLATEYLAGAILLGAAPCTAMVFVWSWLSDGDPSYTLVQVAVNDLLILVAFAPIVALLLGVSSVAVPLDTLLLSVGLFVVLPLTAAVLTRHLVIRAKGRQWFDTVFVPKFSSSTIGGLLLTLVIIFSFQGQTILANPLHILLISAPLALQTFLIFAIAYGWARWWKLPHKVAGPAALIGASNFFELAVAVAISLFGLTSGATLATVVGVLVEVPLMLFLVNVVNRTTAWFPKPKLKLAFVCVGNTSRSQMAESWARNLAQDNTEIFSAGTRPGSGIKDRTRDFMAERGCSMEGQAPSALETLPGDLDLLILMGEGVSCGPLGEKKREDWGFPDLDGSDPDALKSMRDAIGEKVRSLLSEHGALKNP